MGVKRDMDIVLTGVIGGLSIERRQESAVPFFHPPKKIQPDHKKNLRIHHFFPPLPPPLLLPRFLDLLLNGPSVDRPIMATLAEKLEKIKSPKLQNQHHVSPVESSSRGVFQPTPQFEASLDSLLSHHGFTDDPPPPF